MDQYQRTSLRNVSHRSNPIAPTTDDEEYGDINGDTYNVDAVVHSLIAGMEEGDSGGDFGINTNHDDDHDDLDEQDFNETETLFTRINDAPGMGSGGVNGGVGAPSTESGAVGGVLADHEDEMLAHVTSNRDFTNKNGNRLFNCFNKRRRCGCGGATMIINGTCLGITLIISTIIIVASIMISYANQNASFGGGDYHLKPSGLNQAVPPPPSDLDVVCSKHFYSELGYGFDACEKACAPGSCCYEKDMSRNCFKYNLEYCAAYTVCLILNEQPTIVVPTSSNGDDNDGSSTGSNTDIVFNDENDEGDTTTTTTTTENGSQKKVFAPPDDLGTLCSSIDETLSSPACEITCEESKCCFEKEMSLNCYSYSDNYAACDAYRQSCSILGSDYGGTDNDTGTTIRPITDTTTSSSSSLPFGMAPEMVNDFCKEEYVSTAMRGECERICMPAKCCWMDENVITNGETISNCVDGNEEICESYSLCDNLNIIPSRPLLEMGIVCNNQVNPSDDCKESCSKVNCCITPDTERNCFNHYAHICGLYASCATVDEAFEKVIMLPDAPSNLESLCDPNADAHSLNTCRKVCHSAQCCWMQDADECNDQTIKKCIQYEPCDILNQSPPDAPEELSDWCTGTTTEERDTCRASCELATCCIAPQDSMERCYNHEYVCRDYVACSTIDPAFGTLGIDGDNDGPLVDGVPSITTGTDELPSPPSTLSKDCNALNDDVTSISNCETSCEQAQCCISSDQDDNCFQENEIICLEYFSCHTYDDKFASMVEDPYVAPSKIVNVDTLNDNCQATDDEESIDECKELCQGGACCIADDGDENSPVNCYTNFPDDCTIYAESCTTVYPDFKIILTDTTTTDTTTTTTIELESPSSSLSRKCNVLFFDTDPSGRSMCEEECTRASCCIDDSEDENCFADNEMICLEYFPCFSVKDKFLNMIETPYVAPLKLVDTVSLIEDCGNADIDTAAKLDCQEICGGAECCVQDITKANCYESFKNDCNVYAPCSSVFEQFSFLSASDGTDNNNDEPTATGETIELPVPISNLNEICSLDNIEDEETREECLAQCSAADCCFLEEDDIDYCGVTNAIDCETYAVCGILKDTALVPPPLFILEVCGTVGDNGQMNIPASDESACKAICQPASDCCIDDDPTRNCFADKQSICIEYLPCIAIDTKYEIMQTNTEGMSDIGDISDMVSSLTMEGFNEKEGSSSWSSEPKEPILDVNEVCSKIIGGTEEDVEYCKAICSPGGDCCISDSDDNCYKEHMTTCLKYLPCIAIDDQYANMITNGEDNFSVIPPVTATSTYDGHFPPKHLSETCSELHITRSQELYDRCENSCDEVSCCILELDDSDQPDNCFDKYKQSCLSYAKSCSSIEPAFTYLLNEYGSDEPQYVAPRRPPVSLYDACSSVSSENEEECMELCDLASCCVSKNAITNCFDDYGDICMSYMACQSVYDEFKSLGSDIMDEPTMNMNMPPLPEPSGQLNSVCSESAMKLSDTACKILCKASECCFPNTYKGPTPCSDDVQCPNYSTCEKIFE